MSRPIKSLLLARHMPSPTRGGGSMRNHVLLQSLKRLGPAALACIRFGTPVLPMPDGLAASMQTEIPFSAGGVAGAWLHSPFDSSGAFARMMYRAAEMESLLSSFRPDIAICVEPWFAAYAPLLRRHGCRIILDLHNVEASLYGALARESGSIGGKMFASAVRHIGIGCERRAIATADQVWTCSEEDAADVTKIYGPHATARVIESGIDTSYHSGMAVPADLPQTAGKPVLLYCANFGYLPNAEAADALLEAIFPQIRSLVPGCVLVLAGANPTRRMLRAAAGDVIVTGAVDDIRPYWALPNAVSVIPLRHGSGTRLKALEAFAWNVPVVSTRKGMEGIRAADGEHVLLADDAAGVAAGVARVFTEPGLRAHLCANAKDLLGRRYSGDSVAASVERAVADLRAGS